MRAIAGITAAPSSASRATAPSTLPWTSISRNPTSMLTSLHFFEAVNAEMSRSDGRPTYRIGVYGSGLTCKTLLDLGLVKLTWLSQSTGFRGTPEYNPSRRWNLLQLLPKPLCGISVDPNIVTPDKPDFGQFSAGGVPAPAPDPNGVVRRFRAIARDGLRLRSGPGLEFD